MGSFVGFVPLFDMSELIIACRRFGSSLLLMSQLILLNTLAVYK